MRFSIGFGVLGLLVSLPAPAFAQDPTAVGRYSVLTAEYNHGDAAFVCPAGTACDVPDAEMRGEVYYPSALGDGPFPLVVFLHGRHSACYDPVTGQSSNWAWDQGCDPPFQAIPSYRGYDYIGRVLASHGYIVASISANGINGQDWSSADGGITARAYLIEEHLKLWEQFSTSGSSTDPAPFNGDFVGRVDLQHVGTMGHSRGGDGVAMHYALFSGSSPYRVRAVLPLAPTNQGQSVAGVNLGVLLGYCDGDVYTLEGSLFYDRARYSIANDDTTKYTFLSLGSNHNFFNTVWTPECWTSAGACWSDSRGTIPTPATVDDVSYYLSNEGFCTVGQAGNGRLTPAQQRQVGLAYVAGFFRAHLGGEPELLPFLRGDVSAPAPISSSEIFTGYQAGASRRLDLNRFDLASELTQTTLVGTGGVHGAVSANGLETFLRCGFDAGNACFPGEYREAHWPGLSRVRASWNAPTDSLVNELPPGARDVRAFDTLQFRVGADYLDSSNPSPTAFSVTLSDGVTSATVVTTTAQLGSNELYFPPGNQAPTTVMSTMRIPLSAFAGINRGDLRQVTFQYDRVASGTVLVSDLAFVDDEEKPLTAPGCEAGQSFIVNRSASVTTTDGSPAVTSAGAGPTRIDTLAHVDGIVSVGPVEVGASAQVHGDIFSQGTVNVPSSVNVTGSVKGSTPVSLPSLPTLPAFPAPSGSNWNVNPGPAVTLSAGSYRSVNVNSGGRLVLGAGDYFFTDLLINSSTSTVVVTNDTRIYVKNTAAFRAPFVASVGGAVVPITFGYAGTADLRMEARFDGKFMAPQAHVFFGIGSGTAYAGSFFARILEVNPQSSLVCVGSGGSTPVPSCSDGVLNGDETDLDCGGGACSPCENGKSCEVSGDCSSGICAGGTCQASAVTLALSFTSQWAGGYCATLQVTNHAAVATKNWSASLDTNQSAIYSNWNGNLSGPSGVITVTPKYGWNQAILPGATDNSVGFCANRSVPGSGTLPIAIGASATY